jgi:hypothetical protein
MLPFTALSGGSTTQDADTRTGLKAEMILSGRGVGVDIAVDVDNITV